MKHVSKKVKILLCTFLCMLSVMTGCAENYQEQYGDAWQESLMSEALEKILAEVESEYLSEPEVDKEAFAETTWDEEIEALEEKDGIEEIVQGEEDSSKEDSSMEEDGVPEEAASESWEEFELWDEIDQWEETAEENNENKYIDREGSYTTAEDVALYLYTYDELPDNFMTKKEARKLGWTGGSLEEYAPGMCIGGDYFGNHEGLLPKEPGRDYYECDINTLGADSRGAKRIVYSDDGLIYYTEDHYESFTLLYGEE